MEEFVWQFRAVVVLGAVYFGMSRWFDYKKDSRQ